MKKNFFYLVIILTVLTSCSYFNGDEAKKEFSQYDDGKNKVALIENFTEFYFENAKFDIKDIDKDVRSASFILHDNQIFFLSVKEKQDAKKRICERVMIRKCDFKGENIEDVSSVEINDKTEVAHIINGYDYYIKYEKNKTSYIDRFNVITKEYLNIESGENCSLDPYKKNEEKKYEISVKKDIYKHRLFSHTILKHGSFEITDIESGNKRLIDEEYLMKTVFKDSFNLFHPGPKDYVVSNSHILLLYALGAGPSFTYTATTLIFEYDFENDVLKYKLLVFPAHYANYDAVLYID